MRATMRMFLLVATAMVGLSGFNACGTADAIFDCQEVCSRYADCYDHSYDVDGCRSRCRTASAKDPAVRNVADQCQACIGDKSCLSTTFTCAGDCSSIPF